MALVADSVSYTYSAGLAFATEALSGVTVTIEPGELVLVVGATGSGKSTLLRLLAGLLRPTAGTVTLDGDDRIAPGCVGLVFQNPEVQFFAESVLADVEFGPRNLGEPDPRGAAERALAAVGLDPESFGARSPFTLSGGEARRAAVAGVLAMSPAYLLLDEPTAALDSRGTAAVLRAIAETRRRAGVLVVTHDPEQFLPLADRVVVLAAGAVALTGDPYRFVEDVGVDGRHGLRLPEFVRAQLLARARGAHVQRIGLEPREAAEALRGMSLSGPRGVT